MTTIIKGLPFDDDGRLRVSTGSVTARVGGLGIVEADTAVGYTALGGSAVPATAIPAGGFLCDSDGKIYTTTATASSDVYYNGHRFRSDGALVVEATTPSTGDVFVVGWGHEGDNSAAAIDAVVSGDLLDITPASIFGTHTGYLNGSGGSLSPTVVGAYTIVELLDLGGGGVEMQFSPNPGVASVTVTKVGGSPSYVLTDRTGGYYKIDAGAMGFSVGVATQVTLTGMP
jgi:hypothetical protein